MITSHIRRQIDERKQDLRAELFTKSVLEEQAEREQVGPTGLPETMHVMHPTSQLKVHLTPLPRFNSWLTAWILLKGIHTLLRDQTTSLPDFIFLANRLSTLVIEYALSLLPYVHHTITTGTQLPYTGTQLSLTLCGVSILRSGASLEKGLRRVLRDVPIGSMLIQSEVGSGEPLLYHLELPECLTQSRRSAEESYVLLLDSQIGTGAAAMMAVRVLLDHGVKQERILFCCILVSRVGGIWALRDAFPKVRIVTSEVDEGLEERWCGFLIIVRLFWALTCLFVVGRVWPTESEAVDGVARPRSGDAGPKKVGPRLFSPRWGLPLNYLFRSLRFSQAWARSEIGIMEREGGRRGARRTRLGRTSARAPSSITLPRFFTTAGLALGAPKKALDIRVISSFTGETTSFRGSGESVRGQMCSSHDPLQGPGTLPFSPFVSREATRGMYQMGSCRNSFRSSFTDALSVDPLVFRAFLRRRRCRATWRGFLRPDRGFLERCIFPAVCFARWTR